MANTVARERVQRPASALVRPGKDRPDPRKCVLLSPDDFSALSKEIRPCYVPQTLPLDRYPGRLQVTLKPLR